MPDDLGDAVLDVRPSCLSFEAGDLAPTAAREPGDSRVGLAALEVWGVCGSPDDLAAAVAGRAETRKDAAAFIQKARTVDKAAFLDSAFDREHLLGKTFGNAGGADARR